MTGKPYKVKARIQREVEEVVILILDEQGEVVELVEVLEELSWDLMRPIEIQEVQSTHAEAPWNK
jgi:hypothetical protein